MPEQTSLIGFRVGLGDPPNAQNRAKILTLTDTAPPHKLYMCLMGKENAEELRDALNEAYPIKTASVVVPSQADVKALTGRKGR